MRPTDAKPTAVPARRRVARRVKSQIREQAERGRRDYQLGEVVAISPAETISNLRIDLHDSDILLDRNDVDITQWVIWYHQEYRIESGDTLVVQRISGRWVVLDIVAPKQLRRVAHEGDTLSTDVSHITPTFTINSISNTWSGD